MTPRTAWHRVPETVRSAVEDRTGPVRSARDSGAGQSSAFTVVLNTASGAVFVKGVRTDDPESVAQAREAAVNPCVRAISAPLRWQLAVDGWTLLGFDHIGGRHADFRPGSADVARLVTTMRYLGSRPSPDLPQLERAEQRWSNYLGPDAAVLGGDTLLHTDYNPYNVLVDGDTARLVDWARSTVGAAFIDPCCLIVHLIMAGHTPREAEAHVRELPAWQRSPRPGIDTFAAGLARMWTEIAGADPSMAWKQTAASAARSWAEHRVRPEAGCDECGVESPSHQFGGTTPTQ
jgi:hypothetical protein